MASSGRSRASVQAFIGATVSAFADGVVTSVERTQIVTAAQTVLTEAHVSMNQVVAVFMDVQAIATSLGLHPAGTR